MAIINSAVKGLTTNMEPPTHTQKRNKQTNKNILSPAQLFSFIGMLVGVVCHWKVGNYIKEGGGVWVESVCHIYI